ncbi:substance-P receptor isoform X1 [Exaiptasia diaphana]|uniref:G-protein coupled receptors family 1 profile domain-containing protein n=1 Tax=Exaiptasia diaphana TaxID=2652724 RepID=A0A913XHP9_EXADI|nr:substance-P receptor isoform X1 [Exaiptasia diaphana]XP_020904446.1 substance-P receptor isoform X1 [Exaiptasia diaphana]XP_020904448.1 substance-P receptor isoform X1 [Exaiptasia diaphana]XP_028515992.1 substance-P receptor isoform X1 [Exaiptasia diaphana]
MDLFNNTTSGDCYVPPTNPKAEWAKVVTYIALLITSIVGNVIVIRVFTTGQRMRTEVNFLIINVAIADLLIAVINMPMMVRYFVRSANGLPPVWFAGFWGEFWCKSDNFVSGISQICCILSMTAIAFNRYFAIMFPLKTPLNAKKTKLVILLIWLCSCAITSPVLYAMRVKEQHGEYHCTEDWSPTFDNNQTPKYYTLALFTLMYVIPLCLITYLYSCVIHKVWIRHVPGNVTQANQRLEDVAKRRVLKMLITVVIAFALCWLPFHIYLIMVNFYYGINSCDISPMILFLGLLLGHSNSAINPWIYFIFNKDYRRNLKDLCRVPCGKYNYKHVPVTTTRCSTIKSTNGQLSGGKDIELEELKNNIDSSS